MKKYLLRLDDACPTMDLKKWERIERLLDLYNIKPMAGIIPNNNDTEQKIDLCNPMFWEMVKGWESKGWAIAMHGYDHCYISSCRGLNPLWAKSEFAGVPLEIQCEKISKGYEIFKSKNIFPRYFFAPGHTFDENTLEALRRCTEIRIISDTIASKPYKYGIFSFIPQIGGRCRNIFLPGIWTFCLHPSSMTEADFESLEKFLIKYSDEFCSFKNLEISRLKKKSIKDKLLSLLYFTYRNIKGL